MARFTFRLDPFLRMRRRTEEEAKAALGKCVAIETRERGTLAGLERELSESVDEQRRSRDGELWIQGQILSMDWNRKRSGEIAVQEAKVAQAVAHVKEARMLLVEARRAVQVIEKLRERRLEQWKLAEKRREQAELSDIASIRWLRQRTEP